MRFARDPVAAVTPVSARVHRRRADHGEDRDPVVRAQRGHRARHPQPRADDGGDRRQPASREQFHVFILSDTNYPEIAADRGAALRRAEGEVARAASRSPTGGAPTTPASRPATSSTSAPAGARDYDFAVTLDADSVPDRGLDPAPGAHHAGRAEARHPAEPRGRHAVDQRVRAHLPVRHAARHALLHARQRVVAGRLRPLLGPQRGHPPRAVHRALPHPAACRTARRS